MGKALEWLKESLQDIVEDDEDRDEITTVDIPLVPLTEDCITAMELPSFQRLLRAIGIEPPADEQETYWRVPGSMPASTITNRSHLIELALSSADTSFPSSIIKELSIENSDQVSGSNVEKVSLEDNDPLEAANSDGSSFGM